MFIAVYQWRIMPGHEEKFVQAWTRMTEIIREREGSLGSRLHRSEDGRFLAYAQWPSREVFEMSGAVPRPAEAEALLEIMRNCGKRISPDLFMSVIQDRLVLDRGAPSSD